MNNTNFQNYQDIGFKSWSGVKYFNISNPLIGEWKVKITSKVDLDLILVSSGLSSIKMDIKLDKNQYFQYDPIIFNASISNWNSGVTGAVVLAEIEKPSDYENTLENYKHSLKKSGVDFNESLYNSIKANLDGLDQTRNYETLALYDDGQHYDNEPNDGIYGNCYRNAYEAGTYSLNIKISSNWNSKYYERSKLKSTYVSPAEFAGRLVIPSGWSGISFGIDLYDSTLSSFMENPLIQNNLEVLISKDDTIVSGQYNSSAFINSKNGYKVKMKELAQIQFAGNYMADKSFTLRKGMNFMPVLSNIPIEPNTVFDNLSKDFLYAYDIYYSTVYSPLLGLFDLKKLIPGSSYLVVMTNSREITFPTNYKNLNSNTFYGDSTNQEKLSYSVYNTGIPHVISIEKSALQNLEDGDLILILTNENNFAGISRFDEHNNANMTLIAFGDDYTTVEKDGFIENETMKFKLFRTSESRYYPVKVVFNTGLPNTNRFKENGISQIISLLVNDKDKGSDNLIISPNPNDGNFKIIGLNDNAYYQIYDSRNSIISEGTISPNKSINMLNCPKGIYSIKINCNKNIHNLLINKTM